jgi:hypothetical protein
MDNQSFSEADSGSISEFHDNVSTSSFQDAVATADALNRATRTSSRGHCSRGHTRSVPYQHSDFETPQQRRHHGYHGAAAAVTPSRSARQHIHRFDQELADFAASPVADAYAARRPVTNIAAAVAVDGTGGTGAVNGSVGVASPGGCFATSAGAGGYTSGNMMESLARTTQMTRREEEIFSRWRGCQGGFQDPDVIKHHLKLFVRDNLFSHVKFVNDDDLEYIGEYTVAWFLQL